jgi:hypothetical protein
MKLTDMVKNFAKATAQWAHAGCPLVNEKQFAERAAICGACVHWNEDARIGMGRCNLCGCSRAKLFMATQRCPIDKWRPVDNQE